MEDKLFRLDGTLEHDARIEAWFLEHTDELGAIAHSWFNVLRGCGDEVREVLHDGCPVACLGDVPFASVNIFTAHVNVGFFRGALLPDPAHLLIGTGKSMRHVKLYPGQSVDVSALRTLIQAAYAEIKERVEHGSPW